MSDAEKTIDRIESLVVDSRDVVARSKAKIKELNERLEMIAKIGKRAKP